MQQSVQQTEKVIRIVSTAVLALVALVWMIPIIWVILNSFKTNIEFVESYASFTNRWEYLRAIFPESLNFSSYKSLFTGEGVPTVANIDRMIVNSVIVSVSQTLIVLVLTSLSAYAYERLAFPNGEKIFWGVFFLSLVPGSVSILPLFKICNSLGWVNNINALIWPQVAGVMNIFLLRNFMKSIPKEMDEAATIDGAGSFAIYRLVILPSIQPVLMVVALFAFKGAWNDYLWPTIVMNEPRNQTLTSGLALLKGQYDVAQWTNLLASTVISMIAPLLLYLTCQKYFLRGISVQASVKG
ncbi:MAG: carbohydrate ABC transporter permease [Candidatus Excrementavichristensenella sp.]|jgi:multiple sugar transport system permease protein